MGRGFCFVPLERSVLFWGGRLSRDYFPSYGCHVSFSFRFICYSVVFPCPRSDVAIARMCDVMLLARRSVNPLLISFSQRAPHVIGCATATQ